MMGNFNKLKKKVSALPEAPGVYMFKDGAGKVIYIGKAKSLKKRVQSYFNRALDAKTQVMISKAADLDFIATPSQSHAEILEASLVRRYLPQYNIDLRDDKSFPWIRISADEFPVVSVCRRKKQEAKDKSFFSGPYTDPAGLRQAIRLIRKIFGYRSCKKMPRKPCLYGRLDLCPAPCAGIVTARAYRQTIAQIKMFLGSRYEELADTLGAQMTQAALENDFERAACLRDRLNALSALASSPEHAAGIDESEGLKVLLKIDKPPLRIEALDISNMSGKEACGAMVSFLRGRPDKNNYRRFRIKTVSRIDDYAMTREVVLRRYSRLLREKAPLPDFILIDGGKGHLLAAQKELERLNLDIPLAAIAKAEENLYIKNRPRPVKFRTDTPALNLIRRIRDEAHRFAVSYHHILRRKKVIGK
ncbi:MAG: excinuclease ABC subunit UvrC [Candidatus Omnitrophota bacterium]|nr:excinuclease ABC subunit UvrC [Candidatus Omnitrophota bacterium]